MTIDAIPASPAIRTFENPLAYSGLPWISHQRCHVTPTEAHQPYSGPTEPLSSSELPYYKHDCADAIRGARVVATLATLLPAVAGLWLLSGFPTQQAESHR